MGELTKEFAKAFAEGFKEGPRIFFAPIKGAVQGAAKAIREEINRPSPSADEKCCDEPPKKKAC